MRIAFFSRNPEPGMFSIEGVFRNVMQAMPPQVEWTNNVARFRSRGLWRRLYNCIEATLRQGDVNHITGDIHYLSLFLRKRTTLLTIHDCRFLNHPSLWRRFLLKLFWLVIPEKRVGLISVISEATRAEVIAAIRCNPDRVRIVPNCLSPVFGPAVTPFRAAKPTILQIGAGSNKNLMRVAEALQGIPCYLQITGRMSAEQKAHLAACGIDYSNEYDLSDEQLVRKYINSDIVIFASTYEGFGMPIIEANAVGRPVITSDISPMREVAAGSACLVKPFDVASIRAGILRVIDDGAYRDQLIQEGWRNAQRFSPERVARMYVELYEELLWQRNTST